MDDRLRAASRPQPLLAEKRVAPTSFAQQRLWFLDQYMATAHHTYNIPLAIRLEGRLEVEVLGRAIDDIVQRHDILRTTFRADNGQPMQIIAASLAIPLPLTDLSRLPASDRPAQAAILACEAARQRFDLSRGPLLQTQLLRLSAGEHILLLTLHHIIADGWSIDLLQKELTTLYAAFRSGRPSPLPALPLQYAEFAVWQRQSPQGEVLENQLRYWRSMLGNPPEPLELPTDFPRPAAQTFNGERFPITLPQGLVEALKVLGQTEGVTLFIVLLAGFMALLHRTTHQTDIAIGTPVANRIRPEIEPLIGFFVNTLVLRTDLSGNPTIRELLRRVRDVALDGYSHQDIPFDKLVAEHAPARDMSRTPFFQVMLILQPASARSVQLPGLDLTFETTDNGTAKFDLLLEFQQTESGLKGFFNYCTDLFSPQTIQRMAGHLLMLLTAMVEKPDTPVAQLSMLTDAERHQLLVEWNPAGPDVPKYVCLHQLFEDQVRQTPDAIAVIYETRSLTYRELNTKANQLARHLGQRGVGPDVLVGICMQRSLEMVVGLLAVLKAGGAYVPLDPDYPQERIAFMLADAKMTALLTQKDLLAKFPDYGELAVCLDANWDSTTHADGENLSCLTTGENLAYVIYTSGSTGQPKGVMIPHRAICNHMHWMQSTFPLTPADRVLQRTAFSFDASIWEFYAPLLAGAQLIMARSGTQQDTGYLIDTIMEQGVTILQLVPSLLRMLCDDHRLSACRSLRRVYCGGEALTPDLQELFFAKSDAQLVNLYGPTEACIDSAFWICRRSGHWPRIPIGRPISQARIYLLDNHLNPVPVRVTGELYIGGRCLAKGYLNRPELTADRFIPNPFSRRPGAKLYKTGDLGRYLADGNIEYLGRNDHQVKIRGYRIELGEIEASLSRHPAVKTCVIVTREDEPADQRLVAYLVWRPAQTIAMAELRGFLKGTLPDHMLPSAFVVLDALPLMPNGKVDRKRLPVPTKAHTGIDTAYLAPQGPVEEMLTDVWQAVLGLGHIGVHDNFFQLGGHSLLAVRIISRLHQEYDIDLPLRTLFERPTIAALAALIEEMLIEELDKDQLDSLKEEDEFT